MSGKFGCNATHKSVEWYTPKWIFDALDTHFDLDPASPHDHKTEVPARIKITKLDDGLSYDWGGFYVWLNPPYGRETPAWIDKMIENRNGLALCFSRTDSEWMQKAMENASAVLFMRGRINFIPGHENAHKRSRAGAGTVIFAFGDRAKNDLLKLKKYGVLYAHH